MLDVLDPENEVLVKYLHHELPEPEMQDLDKRLLFDEDLFDRLELLETSLIHSFVRYEMTTAEHERFRQGFLAFPQNKEKVHEAQLFHEALRSIQAERTQPPPATPASGKVWFANHLTPKSLIFASLALLILIGLGVFYSRRTIKQEAQQQQPPNPVATPPPQLIAQGNASPSPPTNQSPHKSATPSERKSLVLPERKYLVRSQDKSVTASARRLLSISRRSNHVLEVSLDKPKPLRNPTMGDGTEKVIDNPESKPMLRFSLTLGKNDRDKEYFVTIEHTKFGPIEGYERKKARVIKDKSGSHLIVDVPAMYFNEGEHYRFHLENKNRSYRLVVKRNPTN